MPRQPTPEPTPSKLFSGFIRADELYTIKELQRRLGFRESAWRALKRKGLPCHQVGKRAFVFGQDSSSSPGSRASLGEPLVSESFLSGPKLARSCPRLPKSAAHAELVGGCGAGVRGAWVLRGQDFPQASPFDGGMEISAAVWEALGMEKWRRKDGLESHSWAE